MTMQIDSRRTIGGISVLQLRRFFRHVVAHHHDSFDREWLLSYLKLSEPQADRLLEALASQSFISFEVGIRFTHQATTSCGLAALSA